MARTSILILTVFLLAALSACAHSAPETAAKATTTTKQAPKTTTQKQPTTTTRKAPTTSPKQTTRRQQTTTTDKCVGTGPLKCYACESYPPSKPCKSGCARGQSCETIHIVPGKISEQKVDIFTPTSVKEPTGCKTVKDASRDRTITTCTCNSDFCNSALIKHPSLLSLLVSIVTVVLAKHLF